MKQPIIIPVAMTKEEKKRYGICRGEAYKLVEPFEHTWEDQAGKATIKIPAGLIYDGASVPRGAWTLSGILPDGLIRAAALVHDYIYMNGGKLPKESYSRSRAIKRKYADELFAQMMVLAGIPKWKANLAYSAVRSFGWMAWGSRTKKPKSYTGIRNNSE